MVPRKCPKRWMARAGPVLWPPCSLDLTPCEFVTTLYGDIKRILFTVSSPLQSLKLKTKITEAAAGTDKDTLKKVYRTIENRYALY